MARYVQKVPTMIDKLSPI